MNSEAYLEGYLHKEAGSESDRIAAKYGTKNFKKRYGSARKSGATIQQAAKAGMARSKSPAVATTPTTSPATRNTPPTPAAVVAPLGKPPVDSRLSQAATSSKNTYDSIRGADAKANFANKLRNVYTSKGVAAPAWIDPVESMSTEAKKQEMKVLGKDTYGQLSGMEMKNKHVADTLNNLSSKGITQVPEWMYEEMRAGNLTAANEAQLKFNYMNTPEYHAAWQKGQDLVNSVEADSNKPTAPAAPAAPSGNVLAGNTSL